MTTPDAIMKLVCYGPWRAASLLWRPSPTDWALTIACHAVFELAPKESAVLAKPPPLDPVAVDDDRAFVEPWGPPAPLKASPEVIVVGHAHAPAGNKVTSLVARLEIGDLEKLLHVHGDAWFSQDGALSAPLPFSKMKLCWERAAGGPHEPNPVGVVMGKDAVALTQGRVFVPNLRPMGTWLRRRDDVFPPVGFGPIRPRWPSRTERLHHHAASWDPQRWAEQPIPAGLDFGYFNVAPADQTLSTLAGNELIQIEHLHSRFPKLTTQLAATPPCVVASLAGAEQDVPVVCDTLVIDTDRDLAFLVWRGQIALPHPRQAGVVFISSARMGDRATGTLVGSLGSSPALPFQRGNAVAGTLPGNPIPTKPALPFRPKERAADPAETPQDQGIVGDRDDENNDPPTLRRAALAKLLAGKRDTLPLGAMFGPTVATSIEHCATVAARLASPGADRTAILAAEHLTPEAWEREHTRWLNEIHDELDRGQTRLLQLLRAPQRIPDEQVVAVIERHQRLLVAYDTAYVASLEAQRGPLTAPDYVRLTRAADLGQAAQTLATLKLPEGAMPRIQRVWRTRMSNDPALSAEVHAALESTKP